MKTSAETNFTYKDKSNKKHKNTNIRIKSTLFIVYRLIQLNINSY